MRETNTDEQTSIQSGVAPNVCLLTGISNSTTIPASTRVFVQVLIELDGIHVKNSKALYAEVTSMCSAPFLPRDGFRHLG